MSINTTLYQVIKNHKVVCTGNLRQCLLWLFNTESNERTMQDIMQEGIRIEPVKK